MENLNIQEIQKRVDEANVLIKQLREEKEELQGRVDALAKEKWEKMEQQVKNAMEMNEKLIVAITSLKEKSDGVFVPEEKKQAFVQFLKGGKKILTPEQKKALVEDTTGEILVPEDLEREVIQSLVDEVVMRSLCSVVRSGSDRIRKITVTRPTASWGKLETGATATETNITPSEAVNYIEDLFALVKIGEDELEDSYINLRNLLARDFADAFAEKEDEGFLVGTGHANGQPDGLITGSWGIGSKTSEATGTISLDDILDLYFELKAGYQDNATWLMNSSTALVLAKLKDSNGQYLWKPSVQAGMPSTLVGKPVRLSAHIPAVATGNKAVVFGDFRRGARIYDRVGIAIRVLDQLYAESGLVGFLAKKRTGFAVINPEAFKVLTIQ